MPRNGKTFGVARELSRIYEDTDEHGWQFTVHMLQRSSSSSSNAFGLDKTIHAYQGYVLVLNG